MSPAGSLLVYLQVGDAERQHVGDLDVDLVSTSEAHVFRARCDVRGTLPGLLREVADEIEHPTANDEVDASSGA